LAYEAGFEDMPHRKPDISKAQKLIGFKPQKTMTDIIKDILAWKNDSIKVGEV
jgi:UDP-glucose 4-epimerase